MLIVGIANQIKSKVAGFPLVCLLCISAFGVSTLATESGLTPGQAREWYERCISLKPKMNESYRAQDAMLKLSIKVPSGYYLVPKNLSKSSYIDVTIVNHNNYIRNQCIHDW